MMTCEIAEEDQEDQEDQDSRYILYHLQGPCIHLIILKSHKFEVTMF